jgi:hypothetical protein
MALLSESLTARVCEHLEREARRVPGLQYVMTRAEGVAFVRAAGSE